MSGESADEVSGGYRWFFQPEVQRASAFPWVAALARPGVAGPGVVPDEMFAPGLAAHLDLPSGGWTSTSRTAGSPSGG